MKSHPFSKLHQIVISRFALLVCVLFLFASNAFAQSKVIEKQDPKTYKVGLTYIIPKHLPITVEIRNLDKEDWLSEFEIEVTNTGEKPIYYLNFHLRLPESKNAAGLPAGFTLRYGRGELGDFNHKITSDDVPLKSGESCVLKVPKNSVEGWKTAKAKYDIPESKVIELSFYILRFDDDTGYVTRKGINISASNQN